MVINAMKKNRVSRENKEHFMGRIANQYWMTKEGFSEKLKTEEVGEHIMHSYGGREFQEDGKRRKGSEKSGLGVSKKQQLG